MLLPVLLLVLTLLAVALLGCACGVAAVRPEGIWIGAALLVAAVTEGYVIAGIECGICIVEGPASRSDSDSE